MPHHDYTDIEHIVRRADISSKRAIYSLARTFATYCLDHGLETKPYTALKIPFYTAPGLSRLKTLLETFYFVNCFLGNLNEQAPDASVSYILSLNKDISRQAIHSNREARLTLCISPYCH